MSSGPPDAELTLPVSNLEVATKFYLRVLRPLRFEVISDIQHRARKGPTTRAVALGPGGSQSTVIFLSESDLGVNRTAHVTLPVSSRVDVRDIYTNALDTGVTAARKPAYTSPHGSRFGMSFRDRDGNTFEAIYDDAVTSPSEYADESSVSGHARNGSPAKSLPYHGQRGEAHRRSSSPASKEKSGRSGNAVVGAMIGAAAGVALGYAAWKGRTNSRRDDNEHKAKLQARQLMEEEARANTWDRQSTGLIEQPVHRSRRGSYGQERDSGYSSFGRDESPKRIAYRSGTWPHQSGNKRSTSVDAYSSRRSSRDYAGATKHIEYRPTSSRSGQDRQSEASSQHTVRIGTQISRSNNVSRPPSPPAVPISRPRRSSSVKYRHTVYGTNENDNDRRSVTSNSRKGSVANTLPPSSFPKRRVTVPVPPPSASDKSSQVTAIPVGHPTAPVDQPPTFREPDPSKLDDLETVVPGDSISCVGSDHEEDRRSRNSRQSRRYRSPKRSNRGVDIVRRAGIVLR